MNRSEESPRRPQRPRTAPRRMPFVLLGWLTALLMSCSAKDPTSPPCATASCVDLRLAGAAASLERAPARFEHEAHVKTLGDKSCTDCHTSPDKGEFGLKDIVASEPRSVLIDHYHALCMGCHQQRHADGQKAGPELCGECHRGSLSAASAQSPVSMDLSLHQRHVAAHENKCDKCHHVFDDGSKKLVYRKGAESACSDCHTKTDEGRRLSWQHAAHSACVGCHASRAAAGQKAGPTDCAGCHDPTSLRSVQRLDPIPRLDRGQAAWIWMRAPWASGATVVFPHLKHEGKTGECSTCHHSTLQRCEACHTAQGKAEGGGVTLETAFHDPRSSRSCVGCHARVAAANPECAGCHEGKVQPGGQDQCPICHSEGDAARAVAAANAKVAAAQVQPLPSGLDVPDKELSLTAFEKLYQGARLPHPKILARLDTSVRTSALASRFHAQSSTLCEGCHHHEARGEKPSRCTSCHGHENELPRDRPSAVQAYHRQCTGCHERMGIHAVGCTDCHAKAEATR